MKIFSGDFVAEYNRALTEFEKEQVELEVKYEKIISKIVQRETDRLDQTFPMPFKAGEEVTIDGVKGIVKNCPVDISFVREGEDVRGPQQYYEMRTEQDEYIITCEGMVRSVNVVHDQVSQLEMDWGVTSRDKNYWPDEIDSKD